MEIIETSQNTEVEAQSSGLQPESTDSGQTKINENKLRQYFREHKKLKWFLIIALVVIIGLGGWLYFQGRNKNQANSGNPGAIPSTDMAQSGEKTTTVADPLTGLQVSADAAKQPVVGVMIENLYPDARPQSGLSRAGAVYEAFAEGGITRFWAVFQEPLPDSIGPVRSLRPYYLRWGLEYNIPVVHAGGSQPALGEIGPLKMKNIDALSNGSSAFFRLSDRPSPHNLYTNNSKLSELVSKLGFATAPSFTPLVRKDDTPMVTAAHPNIKIDYGAAAYNLEWQYDAANNNYKRVQGGITQKDRNNGTELTAKNIVVEYTPTSYGKQPDGKPETNINIVGSGKAVVFLDGNAVAATWNKASNSAQTIFKDSAGAEIKFNAGNTWYEIIPVGNAVTY